MSTGDESEIIVAEDSGVNTRTISVPTRNAASDDIIGAPKYGPPAMTMSLPF